MLHYVLIFKAFHSEVVMGKKLHSHYPFDHFDIKTKREKMNQFWNEGNQVGIDKPFDTVLGLTEEKKFERGSTDDDYGISGLGAACGNGKRYASLKSETTGPPF